MCTYLSIVWFLSESSKADYFLKKKAHGKEFFFFFFMNLQHSFEIFFNLKKNPQIILLMFEKAHILPYTKMARLDIKNKTTYAWSDFTGQISIIVLTHDSWLGSPETIGNFSLPPNSLVISALNYKV